MSDFMEGLESPEELLQKQQAYEDQKRKATMWGSIADNLSNRQSLGSVMLNKNVGGFNPSKGVEAGLGPVGPSPEDAYKQKLSGLLTQTQLAKSKRDEQNDINKLATSKSDAEQLNKLYAGIAQKYGMKPPENLSMEGLKTYGDTLEKVMGARERAEGNRLLRELNTEKVQGTINRQNREHLENKAQILGKSMEDQGPMNQAISSIESQLGFDLDDYDPKTEKLKLANGKQASVDIPGVSILGNRVWTGSESSLLKDRAQSLANELIHSKAGSAVSTGEEKRILMELGQGNFGTENNFLAGMQALKNVHRRALQLKESSFAPAVVEEYRSRPGALGSNQLRRVNSAGSPYISNTQSMDAQAASPKKSTKEMSDEELLKELNGG